jgi:L-ascorbate metabolism protein UlaG (beta-lactamase superfamily)
MPRSYTVRSSDKRESEDAMKVRWLGWAGVEIEAESKTLVIDPLADVEATFAAVGEERLRQAELPDVVQAEAEGSAVAGLVSHLHRDHTDAAALANVLAPDAAVHEPIWPGGEDAENVALARAKAELDRAELRRRPTEVWESAEVGPFAITALPAVDGLGDPQVSWLVEADGLRVLHLGDTIFHGYWWRMGRRHGPFDLVLAPINGARVDFPHLQPPSPLPAAMEPEQAALAGELLGARALVPIHYDGYAIEPWYRPVDDPGPRFEEASAGRSYETRVLELGESLELEAVPSGA